MDIWLVKAGEPLPNADESTKLLRTGLLSNELVKAGHNVIWWTSTIDYVSKSHCYKKDTDIEINNRLTVRCIHSIGYKKNVSIRRGLDDFILAYKIRKIMKTKKRPDIIFCAYPPIALANSVLKFAKENKIPIVIDARDMWPDTFVTAAKPLLVPFAYIASRLQRSTVRNVFSGANAITGITDSFVNWGLDYSNRERTEKDRSFPLANSRKKNESTNTSEANIFWENLGVTKNSINICFFGVLSNKLDMHTPINAFIRLSRECDSIRMIICGDGDELSKYKKAAVGCSNIIFPGWIGGDKISSLLSLSSIGLAPYRNRQDFLRSVPTKISEYLSAGLPVITSLEGELKLMLEESDSGLWFKEGNVDMAFRTMKSLCNNTTLRKKLSTNAEKIFKKKYVAEVVYADLVRHLESICAAEAV